MRPVSRPLLITFFIAISAVAVFVDLPGDTLAWRALQNFGHTPLSMALTFVALTWVRVWPPASAWSLRVQYFVSAVGVLATGGAIEAVQSLIGRDAEWQDFGRDSFGVVAALGLFAACDRRLGLAGVARGLSLTLAVVATLSAAAALLMTLRDYQVRDAAMPVLFECASGTRFLTAREADVRCVEAPVEWNIATHAARVTQHPGQYPGVTLREPYADWTTYRQLSLVLWVPGDLPLRLTLRAHDRLHNQRYRDRYNRELTLSPGENRIQIPVTEIAAAPQGRVMDLTSMRGITLYSVRPQPPRVFYIGEIRLER